MLIEFVRFNEPVCVYWSDTGKEYIHKSITEIIVDCNTFKAIETLLDVSQRLRKDEEHQQTLDILISALLQPGLLTALTQRDGLCTPQKSNISSNKASFGTYQSWNAQYLSPEALQHNFRNFVRRLLLTREARFRAYITEQTPFYRLLDWSLIPDDIMIRILRFGQMDVTHLMQSITDGIGELRSCFARKSSRVLLELVNLAPRQGVLWKFARMLRLSCGPPEQLDIAIIEVLVYGSLLANSGDTITLRALRALEQRSSIRFLLQSGRLVRLSAILSFFYWIKATPQGASISKFELFPLARCYRTCRFDARRANRMYVDLKDIGDNYDLSLNFPSGYMKINRRHVVKISIVLAIYRWNYRLRRKKNRPFSDADIAYAKSVGLPIPRADDGLNGSLSEPSIGTTLDSGNWAEPGLPGD